MKQTEYHSIFKHTITILHTVRFTKRVFQMSQLAGGQRELRCELFVVHQLLNASPGSLRLSGAFHLLSWRRHRPCPGSACQDLALSGLSGSMATLAWKIEINVLLIMP